VSGNVEQSLSLTARSSATSASRAALAESLAGATVMMVDDEPITLDVVQAYLEDAGYRNFVIVCDPEAAVPELAARLPDVLLLDLVMPGVSGFDILQRIRGDARFEHIPVIVLTSSTDAADKLRALELGASDFLAKPVDASELVLRLRNILTAKAYVDRLSSVDTLTGLHNRKIFSDQLQRALQATREGGFGGALLHFNIDRFRKINEALGPAMGDEFLRQIAQRLQQVAGAMPGAPVIGDPANACNLSRLGGDEFAAVLTGVDRPERVVEIAQRFLDMLARVFHIGGHELFMTCSIGISLFPQDSLERETLIQNAGVALKGAKVQGGNAYCFYASNLNDRALYALSLQSDLHNAIARNEFRLFYQPKIDARTGKLAGAEALIRWEHSKRGFVMPGEFIPLAEESGLIVDMGAWLMREASRQIMDWMSQGLFAVPVAVNISGRQFKHRGFLSTVRGILEACPIDRGLIQFEITESMLMGDMPGNIAIMNEIRGLGVELALDDFGTGFSSLSYLRRFPVSVLKVDQSFVREIAAQGKDDSRPVITAIVSMAHALGMKVVAEGVETEAQALWLREQGCDQFQGFLFSKPLPARDFTARISR
jgi:diguanylate cyclase (GGDEF)-like protein